MRPTLLNFRSPKEMTPLPLDPKITYDGRSLSFSSPKGPGKTCTFPYEKRFKWYSKNQGGGFMVGPGSYSPIALRNGKQRIVNGAPYKTLHAAKDQKNNTWIMVGDQIVHEKGLFQLKNENKSDFKLSTQHTSDDFKLFSGIGSRYYTPEPNLKHNLRYEKKDKQKRHVFKLNKNHNFIKIERILKQRFKVKNNS